ncbi:MAG: aspartate aminotransferase family protein [Chloroflexota bacterium]
MSYDTNRLKQLDIAHHLHPRTNLKRHAENGPFILAKGDGVHIWDTDGNQYIDAAAGLWNVNVGHGRSVLADTAREQINELDFAPTFFGISTPPVATLAAKLAEMYPGSVNHFQFTSGGAESNETAIKMARYYQALRGKPDKVKILSRFMGYHGIAMGALSATGIPAFWEKFGPRPEGFIHLMAPHAYRNADGLDEDAFVDKLIAELEQVIEREGAETIAAMIGEPVQGAGGVVVPPEKYWSRVSEVLKKNDILLIADEVITGFGRTGTMWGVEGYDYVPDIVSIAKGITSGYIPLGAVGVTDEIYETMLEPDAMFMHGFTYSGHPVACAVANANIKIIEDENLPANAAEQGAYLLSRLGELEGHQNVGNVRGRGLMAMVEIVKDVETKEPFSPADGVGPKLTAAVRKHGIVPFAADNGIMLSPPLTVTRNEVDQIAEAVRSAIVEVLG